MHDRPTVVDLFCGAGGLSHGFMQAGYDVLFGSMMKKEAAKSLVAPAMSFWYALSADRSAIRFSIRAMSKRLSL